MVLPLNVGPSDEKKKTWNIPLSNSGDEVYYNEYQYGKKSHKH